jgi:pimeloyl-ACP methyl ester carboxylesterase
MAQKELLYKEHPYRVAYEILNPGATSGDIVFLHGWGSNKAVMKQAFGALLPENRHIYIDMPGFGKSPMDQVLTTADYAAIITLLLEELRIRDAILVGHSFGGKVAALLEPKRLVLLSSAGIPVPKPLKVRLKIKLFKLIKKIGLGRFYRLFATKDVEGMATNMYETLKNVVDEDFRPIFAACKAQTLIFWGNVDRATPLGSGKTIASLIPGSHFFPLEGDHYFFLPHAPFIAKTIQEELETVSEA